MQIFPHCDVDMWGMFEWAVWHSLNFDKEYLFGFETLGWIPILRLTPSPYFFHLVLCVQVKVSAVPILILTEG